MSADPIKDVIVSGNDSAVNNTPSKPLRHRNRKKVSEFVAGRTIKSSVNPSSIYAQESDCSWLVVTSALTGHELNSRGYLGKYYRESLNLPLLVPFQTPAKLPRGVGVFSTPFSKLNAVISRKAIKNDSIQIVERIATKSIHEQTMNIL